MNFLILKACNLVQTRQENFKRIVRESRYLILGGHIGNDSRLILQNMTYVHLN